MEIKTGLTTGRCTWKVEYCCLDGFDTDRPEGPGNASSSAPALGSMLTSGPDRALYTGSCLGLIMLRTSSIEICSILMKGSR